MELMETSLMNHMEIYIQILQQLEPCRGNLITFQISNIVLTLESITKLLSAKIWVLLAIVMNWATGTRSNASS